MMGHLLFVLPRKNHNLLSVSVSGEHRVFRWIFRFTSRHSLVRAFRSPLGVYGMLSGDNRFVFTTYITYSSSSKQKANDNV